jgi:hypothetical protein
MRLRFGLIGQFLLLLLVACQNTSGGANATSTPSPGDAVDPLETPTTSTFPESESILTPTDAYPPPPPTPIPSPEGYPGPATPFPTPDPYPAGDLVWIIRPVGEQCADPAASDIADLQEAIAELAAAGVPAEASGMVDLVVCAACGCPTSSHYRVQIQAANLSRAEDLGWARGE